MYSTQGDPTISSHHTKCPGTAEHRCASGLDTTNVWVRGITVSGQKSTTSIEPKTSTTIDLHGTIARIFVRMLLEAVLYGAICRH